MAKILCKFHNDTSPSMEVYENDTETIGFCFTCGARTILEGYKKLQTNRRTRPVDLPRELERISNLPRKIIRGLDLHFDDLGYYIVWPTRDFYKRRNWHDNPRYTAPRGNASIPYTFKGTSKTVVIVEGELNARSLYESIKTEDTVVSPGPVTKFPPFYKTVQTYPKVERVVIAVDHDIPGIVYGTELKNKLLKLGVQCILITCVQDYNEMFCMYGPDAVAKHFKENTL